MVETVCNVHLVFSIVYDQTATKHASYGKPAKSLILKFHVAEYDGVAYSHTLLKYYLWAKEEILS